MSPTPAWRLYREDVERVLGEDVVRLLRGWAEARGIRGERWASQPDLWQVATTQAAIGIFEEARAAGAGVEKAILEAAIRVGLQPDTLIKRRRRWAKNALGGPAKERDKLSPASTPRRGYAPVENPTRTRREVA